MIDQETDVAAIRRLEEQRYAAVQNGDFDTFASLCHDQLVYSHSNGERDSLKSYIEKCLQGIYEYVEIDHPVEDIIVVGDVALVLGEMKATLTIAGTEARLDNKSLAVWVRGSEGWKFLAYQPTPAVRAGLTASPEAKPASAGRG